MLLTKTTTQNEHLHLFVIVMCKTLFVLFCGTHCTGRTKRKYTDVNGQLHNSKQNRQCIT